MRKLLLGILVVVGVSAVACTMKAPTEVAQAVSAHGVNPSVAPLPDRAVASATVPKNYTREVTSIPDAPRAMDGGVAVGAVAKPAPVAPAVKIATAAKKDEPGKEKPSKLAMLASAAGSLPMISMMRGEDGRISPINMMLKIRSMMPMCAGGNCVTTSSGFERVPGKTLIKTPAENTAG